MQGIWSAVITSASTIAAAILGNITGNVTTRRKMEKWIHQKKKEEVEAVHILKPVKIFGRKCIKQKRYAYMRLILISGLIFSKIIWV